MAPSLSFVQLIVTSSLSLSQYTQETKHTGRKREKSTKGQSNLSIIYNILLCIEPSHIRYLQVYINKVHRLPLSHSSEPHVEPRISHIVSVRCTCCFVYNLASCIYITYCILVYTMLYNYIAYYM